MLFKVYNGARPSDRHQTFMDRTLPAAERNLLKYAGFGPVTDDLQVLVLISCLFIPPNSIVNSI